MYTFKKIKKKCDYSPIQTNNRVNHYFLNQSSSKKHFYSYWKNTNGSL